MSSERRRDWRSSVARSRSRPRRSFSRSLSSASSRNASAPRSFSARSITSGSNATRRAVSRPRLRPAVPCTTRYSGSPASSSNRTLALDTPSVANANDFTLPRCVVTITAAPRSSMCSSAAMARHAPSSGSVPSPISSMRHNVFESASRHILSRWRRCEVKVLSDVAIDCSSPISA